MTLIPQPNCTLETQNNDQTIEFATPLAFMRNPVSPLLFFDAIKF